MLLAIYPNKNLYPQKTCPSENLCPQKPAQNVHSIFTHDCQKLEATKMSSNRQIDKLQPHNEILFSDKNKQAIKP